MVKSVETDSVFTTSATYLDRLSEPKHVIRIKVTQMEIGQHVIHYACCCGLSFFLFHNRHQLRSPAAQTTSGYGLSDLKCLLSASHLVHSYLYL